MDSSESFPSNQRIAKDDDYGITWKDLMMEIEIFTFLYQTTTMKMAKVKPTTESSDQGLLHLVNNFLFNVHS